MVSVVSRLARNSRSGASAGTCLADTANASTPHATRECFCVRTPTTFLLYHINGTAGRCNGEPPAWSIGENRRQCRSCRAAPQPYTETSLRQQVSRLVRTTRTTMSTREREKNNNNNNTPPMVLGGEHANTGEKWSELRSRRTVGRVVEGLEKWGGECRMR